MADRPAPRYACHMRNKWIIAAAAAVGTSAGAIIFAPRDQPPAPPPPLALPVVAAHFNTADRMEITQAGQTLRLERRGESWGLAQEGGYPVRPETIIALIDELQAIRLLHPEPGATLDDPADPAGRSVQVRVRSISGEVIGALVLGGPANTARRPNEPTVYATTPQITVSADPSAWVSRTLPALGGAAVVDDGGMGAGPVAAALARLRFVRALAAPQIHLQSLTRVIRLAAADGDAVLRIGLVDGKPWLLIAGSSRWAATLSPYGFALPPDSPLAGQPGTSL